MQPEDLSYLSIPELAKQIKDKKLSPVEVTQNSLDRIHSLNGRLNAFITILDESALESARMAEAEIHNGNYRGPLHGIPIGLKDLFAMNGVRTTCGSRILYDFTPDQDSVAVAKLRTSGAVLIGKLNLSEFAYGPTGANAHYGAPLNPWDSQRISGGSSSGSAVATAAGLVYGALGTDTGGSIRIPSALCGITGLKPSYGLVSLRGVYPLSRSMDHAGPMARSAVDCAYLLSAIAGDSQECIELKSTTWLSQEHSPHEDLAGLRIGIPKEIRSDESSAEVTKAINASLQNLASHGAHIEEVSVPSLVEAHAASSAIMATEAAATHLEYLRTQPNEYSDEVRHRLQAGLAVPGVLYIQAQRIRRILTYQMNEALSRVDILVTPGMPSDAPALANSNPSSGELGQTRQALTRFTRPYNLTGQPAIVVPCGFSSFGLPLSLQMIGRTQKDAELLRIAHAYQLVTRWHLQKPPIERFAS